MSALISCALMRSYNKLGNAVPTENALSAVVQAEVEHVLIKPHSLRRKEMLNGSNK